MSDGGGLIVRALVVYEAMTGNLHEVAMRVALGLTEHAEVTVIPVGEATPYHVAGADLLVVGAPSDQPWGPLDEWLDDLLPAHGTPAAVFDTCIEARAGLVESAAEEIAGRLAANGYALVAPPQRFFVDYRLQLLPGEAERAAEWGTTLAPQLV